MCLSYSILKAHGFVRGNRKLPCTVSFFFLFFFFSFFLSIFCHLIVAPTNIAKEKSYSTTLRGRGVV